MDARIRSERRANKRGVDPKRGDPCAMGGRGERWDVIRMYSCSPTDGAAHSFGTERASSVAARAVGD